MEVFPITYMLVFVLRVVCRGEDEMNRTVVVEDSTKNRTKNTVSRYGVFI